MRSGPFGHEQLDFDACIFCSSTPALSRGSLTTTYPKGRFGSNTRINKTDYLPPEKESDHFFRRRLITAFASLIAGPSSPVRLSVSFVTFRQTSPSFPSASLLCRRESASVSQSMGSGAQTSFAVRLRLLSAIAGDSPRARKSFTKWRTPKQYMGRGVPSGTWVTFSPGR